MCVINVHLPILQIMYMSRHYMWNKHINTNTSYVEYYVTSIIHMPIEYNIINTTSLILHTRYHTPPTMLKSTPKKLLMCLAHLLTYNTLIALIFFTFDGSPLATYSVTIASRKRAIDLRCFQLTSLGCIIHTRYTQTI